MAIIEELWTKKRLEPDVKTTYQYVIDLQTKLQENCKLATEEIAMGISKAGENVQQEGRLSTVCGV